MRIYRFDPPEGYEWVGTKRTGDYEVFNGLDGTPRAEGWTPVPVQLIKDDGAGHQFHFSDFPWLGRHAPVMRRRARENLKELLAPYGELLPLECDDADLCVLNVTCVIDALDLGRSTFKMFPDGVRIMRIKQHVFRRDVVDGVQVFKIPQMSRAGTVYVNHDFVDAVERAGLEGVGFRLLWDDELSSNTAST